MSALYSRGFCLSACLLKFPLLESPLSSDYANFTAKANSFALARCERVQHATAHAHVTCTGSGHLANDIIP